MTPADVILPEDCARFRASIDEWFDGSLDSGVRREFTDHRSKCASCSELLAMRTSTVGVLRAAGKLQMLAPSKLDAFVKNVGEPEGFVRLMLNHVEPVSAPQELDQRVLVPDRAPSGVLYFSILKKRQARRRMILVAAASLFVAVAAGVSYKSIFADSRERRANFKFSEVSASEIPEVLRSLAGSLSGDVTILRKG
ncbi:MAG: hypothetical protein ACKVS6_08165 [Planctomycetota bacterium]